MKDEQKQLEILKEKISSTWALLDIDGQIAHMHGLEKEMRQPGFWDDNDNATKVSKQHEELRSEIQTWETMREQVDELISLCGDLEKIPIKKWRKRSRNN